MPVAGLVVALAVVPGGNLQVLHRVLKIGSGGRMIHPRRLLARCYLSQTDSATVGDRPVLAPALEVDELGEPDRIDVLVNRSLPDRRRPLAETRMLLDESVVRAPLRLLLLVRLGRSGNVK
jgi:hypothetical protein